MMHQLTQTAANLGLPFGQRTKTYNSRLAQELGLWAESKEKGDAFHEAAFRAYFVDGKNIAQIPVLLDVAAAAALPVDEAADVIETRAFKAPVDADWSLARERGVTAVPTFMINQEKLVGAQPYQVLEKFVAAKGASKSSAS